LLFFAGTGGSSGGDGGGISIESGLGVGSGGAGGTLNIIAGNAGTTGVGGEVSLIAGAGGGTSGVGGSVALEGGVASGSGDDGGGVFIKGGFSSSGDTGVVALQAQDGGFVGIGTFTPSSNLHILTSGTSGLGSVINDRGLAITGVGGQSRIYMEATDATTGERVFALDNTGGLLRFSSLNNDASSFTQSNLITIDHGGGVGIGSTPIASAILNVASVTKGFMQPRLTDTQRDAISSPATGLSIYNTEAFGPQSFDGDGWRIVSTHATATHRIYTAAQLEALASGGVITLTEDTAIEFMADISSATRFDLNGFALTFPDRPISTTYSFTGGTNDLFSGDGIVRILRFNNFTNFTGATFIDVTAGTALFNGLTMTSSIIIGFGDLGTITDGLFIVEQSAFIAWGGGFTLQDPASWAIDVSQALNGPGGTSFITLKNTLRPNTISTVNRVDVSGSTDSLLNIDAAIPETTQIAVIKSISLEGDVFDTSGVNGVFDDVFDVSVALLDVDSITDSSGVARFNFTVGPTLFVDQEVDISNCVTETGYNQTGFITATGAGFYEIASIAFTGDDATCDFSSDSVQLFDTAHGLSNGTTLVVDQDDGTDYDGGATIYNVQANTFEINRTFTFTTQGTWDTGGLDQTDPRVVAFNMQQSADSEMVAFGEMNANATVTTVDDGAYLPIDVSGFADNAITERLKLIDATAGIYEFIGHEDCSCFVTAPIWALKSGSTEEYRFVVSINGAIPTFATAPYTPLEVKTAKTPTTILEPVQLTLGDTVQVMIAGDGTGDDPTITDFKLRIK